jgi:hypothetical protein
VTAADVAPFTLTVVGPGVVIVGAVTSWTFTENDPLDELPRPSEPVQFTVEVPSGKVEPDCGEHETVTGPCGSEPAGLNVTTALGTSSTSTVTSGSESEGPVVSTVHEAESEPVSAPALVARTVKECEPSAKPLYDTPDEQPEKPPPSREHSIVADGSSTVKPNAAESDPTTPLGPLVIETTGGSASASGATSRTMAAIVAAARTRRDVKRRAPRGRGR